MNDQLSQMAFLGGLERFVWVYMAHMEVKINNFPLRRNNFRKGLEVEDQDILQKMIVAGSRSI